MTRTLRRRSGAAVAALLATVLAGALTALPAQAAETLDPANRLGDITLTPTSGTLTAGGGPTALSTTAGCPEGFRGSSRTLFQWADGSVASKFPAIVQAAAATGNGLDGAPMARTGTVAARWITAGFPLADFKSGLATYLVTCEPGTAPDGTYPAATDPIGSAKYFSVTVRIDTDAKTWAVEQTEVVKADTTTALAPTAGNDGSVVLTATVAPAAATGAVSFIDVDSGAQVGSGTLSGAVATATVSGLAAGSTHRFRADYAGDAAHNGSQSGIATVTTVAEPVPPQDTAITVTIPAAATGLKFTVTPGNVALSQATLQGSSYVASGTLGDVTVSDNRAERAAWTLNGKASAFVNTTDATATIPASALGWTPALVGATHGGSAGAAVTAGDGAGLSTDRALAQAGAGATVADTTVKAAIALKAAAGVRAGDYTATLTLTLI